MGRLVKCEDTNSKIDIDSCIKVNGKYYSSQEAYEKYSYQNDCRKKIIDFIAVDMMGYETGGVFPSYITRELREVHIKYEYSQILRSLLEVYDYLLKMIGRKKFKNDFQLSRYIFTVVSNHLIEGEKAKKRKERSAAKGKALADKYDGNEYIESVENLNNKPYIRPQKRDISIFVEGDD